MNDMKNMITQYNASESRLTERVEKLTLLEGELNNRLKKLQIENFDKQAIRECRVELARLSSRRKLLYLQIREIRNIINHVNKVWVE